MIDTSHHETVGEHEADIYQRAESLGMDLDAMSDDALIRRMGASGEGIGDLSKSSRRRLVEIGLIVRTREKGGFVYSLTQKGKTAVRRVRKSDDASQP